MTNTEAFIKQLYTDFNDRNIEAVIAHLSENVQWANGMEGGFVHGHDGVREYWTRQFTMISSTVTPMDIHQEGDLVKVKVHQIVYDVSGKLLMDEILTHNFTFAHDKVAKFEIGGDHIILPAN